MSPSRDVSKSAALLESHVDDTSQHVLRGTKITDFMSLY